MKFRFFLILALGLGAAVAADDVPRPVGWSAAKVLFLGNSITRHAPKPDIGWTGDWGMAASAAEKDYVHLMAVELAAATGVVPRTMVSNVADFERGYESFDAEVALAAELAFGADLVVLAIGENVAELSTPEARAGFAAAYGRLLQALQRHGKPTIVVRSCFWPNEVKDGIMRQASGAAGAVFVDLAALGRDPSHAAKAERPIDHPGVAAHPGDKGMRAIADALMAALQPKAALPPGEPAK